jgi:glycosyltransferase involved in cell wall biosynthesis
MSQPAILILVENLPVPLDRRVWQEACALRDAGYKVVVICPQMRGYVEPEEVLEGIHIYRHWISEEAKGFAGFLREYASALWGQWWLTCKVWRHHGIRLIHLCNPPDLLWVVAWPFRLFGRARVIYDIHDLWPEMFEAKFGHRGAFYWGVRLAERMTHLLSDVVLATNESVKGVALQRGRWKSEDVFVVRTAPKISTGDKAPNPLLKRGREYLVGYVGVMGNADGVHYLIEAADHLVNRMGRRDIQFLLMGSGPEYPALVALRDRLGLADYVEMPGRVSDAYLFSALQTIDAGVACDPINAYNDHCTMNKTLEYMAFGKPQVLFGTREGRASAGDAAVYVSENSSVRLAEAISGLLDDPERRKRMGAIGAERLRSELNWERSVKQLLAAYARALR